MQYEKLFSEGQIGSAKLKNRVAMSPMVMGTGTPSGIPSEQMMTYYEARAKGGAGLIITEATRVEDRTGALHPLQLAMSHDYHIAPFSKMVERIHQHGAKIFVQLHHPGRQNYSLLMETINISQPIGKLWHGYWDVFFKVAGFNETLEKSGLLPAVVAPSNVPCQLQNQKTRALRHHEIKKIISAFGDAALRVKKSGADGIELHGAHGYLIQQFLSPHTNRRTDEYGGSFENRMRFISEIIAGIRQKCGNDFPLTVRLSVDEFYDKIGKPEQGLHLEDGVKIAQALEKLGVDALNISSATYETKNYWLEPVTFDIGWRSYLAETIKKAVSIPVLAANNIRTPKQAEAQLQNSVQDFICLGRPLLADPDWAKKAQAEKSEDITHCISCLWCFESMLSGGFKGVSGECAVNPRTCREYEIPEEPVKNGNKRTIVIIGTGPAGLMAAKVLSQRDFNTVVLEKNDKSGGQLLLGNQPPKKEKISWCFEDLQRDTEKNGTEFHFNTVATIEKINKYKPYAVFLASGAREIVPNLPGVHNENVYCVSDILSGKISLENKDIAVIGSGMTGLETAEFLADKGNEVTVFEMAEILAPGVYHQHLDDILPKLRNYDVKMLTSRQLMAIDTDEIIIQNTKTKYEYKFEVDAVVLSIGVCPENTLAKDLKQHFKHVAIVGDAQQIGRIAEATHSAFDKAINLE